VDRGEHPLLPIVAGGLLALAGSSYLLLLIGLHHQVQRSSPKRAGRLIGVAVLVVVASVLRDLLTPWGDQTAYFFTDDSRSPAVTLVLGIGSLACFMLVTLLTRSRREGVVLRDRADREHDRASELSEEVARQSERERIAREVHDTLASRLAAVALQGDELSLAVAQGDSDIDSIARSLRQDARRSLDDLRGLLGELREGPVADYDPSRYSMRRIGELVRSARAAGTPVDAMILVDGVERAAAVLDHTVFRIVQEALTNAMKHAAHAPVSIVVEATPGGSTRAGGEPRGRRELDRRSRLRRRHHGDPRARGSPRRHLRHRRARRRVRRAGRSAVGRSLAVARLSRPPDTVGW
jgi:signal transduction histidine kinase